MLEDIKSNPLISVIITVFIKDSAKFFRASLKSLIVQTYPFLQIVIVADGPLATEHEEVIDELLLYSAGLTLKRQILLIRRQRAEGPAKARNEGIMQAKGEFIAIMDADDISLPNRISSQFEFLSQNNLDVSSSNYIEIDADDNVIGTKKMPLSHNEIKDICPFLCPMNNPAIFARKEALLNGYQENLRFGEDYRLWISLLKKGYRFGNHPDNLIKYRENAEFHSRRRGWSRGWSDFYSKLLAMPLVRFHKRPLVLLVAILTFLVRLLPTSLLAHAYKVRRLMSFRRSQDTPTIA